MGFRGPASKELQSGSVSLVSLSLCQGREALEEVVISSLGLFTTGWSYLEFVVWGNYGRLFQVVCGYLRSAVCC